MSLGNYKRSSNDISLYEPDNLITNNGRQKFYSIAVRDPVVAAINADRCGMQ